MNEYILLIQGNEKTATTDKEWDAFFAAARASGAFRGGSEIGRRETIGDGSTALSTAHVVGFMRFETANKQELLDLLQQHPVVRHGGSLELCELPKSGGGAAEMPEGVTEEEVPKGAGGGTAITLEDLTDAFYWSSAGQPHENRALLNRETARVHRQSHIADGDEDLPDDLDDFTRYIAVPHKNELDLGRRLVFAFIIAEAPHLEDRVHEAFRRRGAYAKFKGLLDRAGLLDRWHAYEAAAEKAALLRWAAENGFVVTGLAGA